MHTKLSLATLGSLSSSVAVPGYSRHDLTAGIVHFGVGNFHRAHMAVYLDELFRAGHGHDWAVIGAGVRDADVQLRAALHPQDWLTTVVEQEATSADARVTGAMVGFIPPFDVAATLDTLARPEIRIVSITITEGGYYISPATQKFDATHPDIFYDAQHMDAPKTVFGLILAGLLRRRKEGTAPFTVMSCDNIPGNGHVTENAVAGLAMLFDPELAAWVRQHVTFPNAMVDRITPATSNRERSYLLEHYGVEDNWPVFCEGFRQWVIEDHFCNGRPPLEKVGVTFVADVAPYELMKIRILNGGHAAIAYPAALLDIHFVHEAMEHPLINAFLAKLTKSEIISAVIAPPNVDLEEYRQLIDRRFSNPKIGDTITRLAFDGSSRQPKFILPTVVDRLKAQGSIAGLALVSALWCRYCYGETESGKAVAANDPIWERLQKQAKAAKANPAVFLEMQDIFGDLTTNSAYVAAFSTALSSIWSRGVVATLEDYLADRI